MARRRPEISSTSADGAKTPDAASGAAVTGSLLASRSGYENATSTTISHRHLARRSNVNGRDPSGLEPDPCTRYPWMQMCKGPIMQETVWVFDGYSYAGGEFYVDPDRCFASQLSRPAFFAGPICPPRDVTFLEYAQRHSPAAMPAQSNWDHQKATLVCMAERTWEAGIAARNLWDEAAVGAGGLVSGLTVVNIVKAAPGQSLADWAGIGSRAGKAALGTTRGLVTRSIHTAGNAAMRHPYVMLAAVVTTGAALNKACYDATAR
jgi:hypothetical protein